MKTVSRNLRYVTPSEKEARERARYVIQHEINTLNNRLAEVQARSARRLVEARLASLPAELRDDLRTVLATTERQRSDTQMALAARYEKELRIGRDELIRLDAEFKEHVAVTKARIKNSALVV